MNTRPRTQYVAEVSESEPGTGRDAGGTRAGERVEADTMATSEVKTSNDPRRSIPATGEYRVIAPGQTFRSVTEKIARIVLTPHTPLGWFALFTVAGGGATMLLVAVTWLFLKGVGIWAITQPVAWGFAIINFVWWIGIGHAGTLISAILLLFKQGWRNSISRFAEAMTIFAVVCAGMFPLIHVGRPWLGYWMLPAALHHDRVAAVPLAADVGRLRGFDLRDHLGGLLVHRHGSRLRHLARPLASRRLAQYFYGMLAWAGAARCATGCATRRPRCCWPAWPRRWCSRVHTVISFDFAVAVLPGWHTTIFPPYFVAGAIYSGFAMVLTLAIPLRKFYHLEALVTERHIDNMGKVMLATGFIVAYGYGMEAFMAWYSAVALGSLHVLEPRVRADGLVLLGADHLQPGDSADHAVVAQAAHQHPLHVLHLHRGEHGHVV